MGLCAGCCGALASGLSAERARHKRFSIGPVEGDQAPELGWALKRSSPAKPWCHGKQLFNAQRGGIGCARKAVPSAHSMRARPGSAGSRRFAGIRKHRYGRLAVRCQTSGMERVVRVVRR